MTDVKLAPVTRTSGGLVDALFDSIDRLNARTIDTEHARAIAHSARAIVGIASLELEFRKLQRDAGMDKLRSLSITDQAATAPPEGK